MQEGYGHDWTNWDNFINAIYPRPADVRYQNWYPFKSPKGVMMAFYNNSYGDIRVINLETKEVVVNEFYSHEDADPAKNWYKSHTNVSTYVPSYWVLNEKNTDVKGVTTEYMFTMLDYDIDPLDEETLKSYGEFKSLPFAFNAWTIWGMDFEFYVDILDLTEIDDGIIRKWKDVNYVITKNADHVRNFIHHSTDINDTEDDISCDFKVLEERWKDRVHISKDGVYFYDMYKIKSKEDIITKGYSKTTKPQWMVDKENQEARETAKIKKE